MTHQKFTGYSIFEVTYCLYFCKVLAHSNELIMIQKPSYCSNSCDFLPEKRLDGKVGNCIQKNKEIQSIAHLEKISSRERAHIPPLENEDDLQKRLGRGSVSSHKGHKGIPSFVLLLSTFFQHLNVCRFTLWLLYQLPTIQKLFWWGPSRILVATDTLSAKPAHKWIDHLNH